MNQMRRRQQDQDHGEGRNAVKPTTDVEMATLGRFITLKVASARDHLGREDPGVL